MGNADHPLHRLDAIQASQDALDTLDALNAAADAGDISFSEWMALMHPFWPEPPEPVAPIDLDACLARVVRATALLAACDVRWGNVADAPANAQEQAVACQERAVLA